MCKLDQICNKKDYFSFEDTDFNNRLINKELSFLLFVKNKSLLGKGYSV